MDEPGTRHEQLLGAQAMLERLSLDLGDCLAICEFGDDIRAAMLSRGLSLVQSGIDAVASDLDELAANAADAGAEPRPAPAILDPARLVSRCEHLPQDGRGSNLPYYVIKLGEHGAVLLCRACALAAVTAWQLPQQPQDQVTLACPHAMDAPTSSYAVAYHRLLLCHDCAQILHSALHLNEIGIAPIHDRRRADGAVSAPDVREAARPDQDAEPPQHRKQAEVG